MPGPQPVRSGDPQWIGECQVIARLGEGGQGVVYLCVTPESRKVAVKLLHRRFGATEQGRRLFTREIEAAGRVRGYTARVLDSGEQGGRPFIVSEYIEGESVQSRVDTGGPYEPSSLLLLASETASALAAIHEAGLVHCDFKPANILLGPDGARVIDFGIVRALDTIAMGSHELRGTPAYMAPEQISGGNLGRHTDVFAWASTMVFAATGTPPFGNDPDGNGVMFRITSNEPFLDGVPAPLHEIVEACLCKDPAKRPTVHEALTMLRPRTTHAPPRTPKELTGHTQPITCIACTRLGDRPIALTGSQDRTARIWDLTDNRQLGPPLRHDAPVSAVACGSALALTACQDQTLHLWDLATGARIAKPLHTHQGPVLALSIQDELAVSVSADRTLVWDLPTLRSQLLLRNNPVMSVACCVLDGRPVAITGGAWDRVLRIVDLTTRRLIGKPLSGHDNTVTSVTCCDLDGKPIAVTGGYDRTARIWDLAAHRELTPSLPHSSAITSLALGVRAGSPILVTAAADRNIRIFDLPTRHPLGAPLTMETRNRTVPLAVTTLNDHPALLTAEDATLHLLGLPL